MPKDCWTCKYDDVCERSMFEPVLSWTDEHCTEESADGVLRPPRDGDHPDCPGHEEGVRSDG